MVFTLQLGVTYANSLLLPTFLGLQQWYNIMPYNFTLRVSTEVYGSRILSSIYILLTVGSTIFLCNVDLEDLEIS